MRSQAAALGVCAGIGLLCSTTAWAQKTVVTVEKGAVRAQTSGGEATVEAGQKAVLTAGRKPISGVNDPMVDDLMALSRWVDAERQSKRVPIDSASIQVVAVENDRVFRAAFLFETLNQGKEPRTADRIENMSGAVEPRFYDLQGRLLRFDAKKTGVDAATYTVQLQEPVAPGASSAYLCVTEINSPKGFLSSDGRVWRFQMSNGSPNCLNVFRFILPKSAILIDSGNRPVLVSDRDGRVTVTFRNHTGTDSGAEHVLFLWPDKDGAGLDDVPAAYRGGQDAWKASVQEQYREQMAKIRAGQDYTDHSTPLAALLSANAALIRKDRARFIGDSAQDSDRAKAEAEFARMEAALGGIDGVRELLVDTIDVVSMSPWPTTPREGATCEVDKFAGGSQLRNWTTGFVFRDGKWRWAWNRPGPGLPSDGVWIREHSKPRSAVGADADRNAALTREYQTQMDRIRKGADYDDQSTPLATLLTRNAAIIRDDLERAMATVDPARDPQRREARKEFERLKKEFGAQGVRELIVDVVDSVSSPVWPAKPSEDAVHRIDMFGKASSGESPLPAFTMFLVYRDGKWYVQANQPGPGHPKMKR